MALIVTTPRLIQRLNCWVIQTTSHFHGPLRRGCHE